MDQQFLERTQNQLKKQRRKRLWKRVVSVLGSVVVFCTTYALILPAITMSDKAYCGIEEHVHEEACYNKKLICGYDEDESVAAHKHTESCYESKKNLICTLKENSTHIHDESCTSVEKQLSCGQEEIEGHVHTDQCMKTETIFICGLEGDESHVHDEGCTQEQVTIICGLEESEGHIHLDSCYTEVITETCHLEEAAHVHTEACWEESQVLICEISTDQKPGTHEHTEACYEKELICTMEEHTHELACFANPKADLESASDWERTLPGSLSGDLRKDVIAIAESQLGYTESDKNYIVTEDEPIKGYTRYGEWYGDPYGHWCAMFASFCLDYANADVPLGSACSSWIRRLKEKPYEMYREPEEYTPSSGDIIFFDWEVNGDPDHVGLVAEVIPAKDGQPAKVKTIEGNCSDCVMYMTYDLNNPCIFGYGEIAPEKQNEGNGLKYEDDSMIVNLTFQDDFEIPEDAELRFEIIDSESDQDVYEEMSQAVSDAIITEEDKILGSLNLYRIEVISDEEVVEIPEDIETVLNIEYKKALYTEDQMKMAAELTIVELELAAAQTFKLRSFGDQSSLYDVSVPEATVDNKEEGVTGFTLKSSGVPSTIGILTEITTRTGNFWKRVDSFTEIQEEDVLMIVSVEGNMALTYSTNTSNVGTSVILEQVKGNKAYYDILERADKSSMAEGHQTAKFTALNVSNNKLQLRSVSNTNRYVVLGSNVFGTSATTLNIPKQSTENDWKIYQGSNYLTFSRSIPFISLSTASNNNARRDMWIFRLVNTSLDIPSDATNVSNPPTIPDVPEYGTLIPTDETEGATSVSDLEGFTVGYASDQATSDLLEKFTGIEADDGKILTDKSVIYGMDDFGAIDTYEEGTFGVTLSALGQVSADKGHVEPLMDVVIILDTSYSMINNSASYLDSNGDVRMVWAMKAVNSVIDQIMKEPGNRVGLVTFSDTSQVVLPLEHYSTVNGQYLDLVKDTSKNDSTASVNHGRGTNFYDLNIVSSVKNSAGVTPSFNFLYGPGYPNWEGTYTQSGIQEAADILLNNPDTVDENNAARQPVIILISDGGPTLCSSNYKAPLDGPIYGNSGQTAEGDMDVDHNGNSSNGTGGNRYGINGYYTILTAEYYKNLVGSHYGVQTKFATVGIGIEKEQGSSTDKRLHDNRYCRAVLNPTAANLADAVNTFDNFTDEGQQLVDLLNGSITSNYISIPNHSEGYTTIGRTYSAVPVIPNPYTSFDYADHYYTGTSTTLATDLISYLNKIQFQEHTWQSIIENQTSLDFEDPIGEGMEVKGEPILRFGMANYEPTSIKTKENVTTYVYDYQLTYAQAYPDNQGSDNVDVTKELDLSRIVVTVTTVGEGLDALQTVHMHIPEDLVPVVYPEKYGKFYYKEAPVRLTFKVGLTEAAIEDSQSIGAGETRAYYTNRYEGITTEAKFTPYNGEDHPNDYPFDQMSAVNKEGVNKANPTGTINTSLNPLESGEDIVQQLGNNGKLILTKEATSITVTKKWSDTVSHNPIQVNLLADGVVTDTIDLSSQNNWTYTWTSLPKINYSTKEAIVYSVSENYVSGYTPTIEFIEKGSGTQSSAGQEISSFSTENPFVLVNSSTGKALAAKSNGGFEWVDIDLTSNHEPTNKNALWIANSSSKLMNVGTEKYVGYDGNTGNRYFVSNSTQTSGAKISYSSNKLTFNITTWGTTYTYRFTGIDTGDGTGTASWNNGDGISFDIYQWTTITDKVETDTFIITNTKSEDPLELTIKKTTSSGMALEGAKFDLYMVNNEDGGAIPIPGTDVMGIMIHHDLEVGIDGLAVEIPGDDGEYYLIETKAPEGFELLDAPIKFVVKDEKVSMPEANDMAEVSGNTISVINNAQYELPETGGAGTMIYRIAGILMMFIAAIILIKRRFERRFI